MSLTGYLLSIRVLPNGNLPPRATYSPEDMETLDHGYKVPNPVRPIRRMLNEVLLAKNYPPCKGTTWQSNRATKTDVPHPSASPRNTLSLPSGVLSDTAARLNGDKTQRCRKYVTMRQLTGTRSLREGYGIKVATGILVPPLA